MLYSDHIFYTFLRNPTAVVTPIVCALNLSSRIGKRNKLYCDVGPGKSYLIAASGFRIIGECCEPSVVVKLRSMKYEHACVCVSQQMCVVSPTLAFTVYWPLLLYILNTKNY